MAANLFTPILNDRIRSIHFFNGRLLTGEDMTAEQRGQHAAHELLAQSLGDGIMRGLEVTIDDTTSLATPVVKVTQGVAVNRKGETLLLPSDTRVQLVRTADAAPPARTLFTACTPPESGVYVAGAGVYLLTLCSTVAADGSAAVSGLGGQPSGCNTRFAVDAVQFRLIELPMTDAEMGDIAHLRNLVAYRCFGISSSFANDPFGTTTEPPTLLDQVRPRSLTDCDVPLATFYWTATGGLVWADMWSVRRRTAHTNSPTKFDALRDPRFSTIEAMVLQFQEQVASTSSASFSTLVAANVFTYLPPLGILPTVGGTPPGLVYSMFFGGTKHLPPTHIEGARLHQLCQLAMRHPPIRIGSQELIRLYLVREHRQAIDAGTNHRPALLFVNGHVPDTSDPHFDLAYWNYANFV